MPTIDCATDIAPASVQGDCNSDSQGQVSPVPVSKPGKGLLYGFAATVTIGLGLASWYVGVRIVAADEVTPSHTHAPLTTPARPTVTVTDATLAQASLPLPIVLPTELFLQAAGLGPKRDAAFVRSLEAKGFRARIETRDDSPINILIGPFSSRAEMERGERALESEGILAVETAN